MRKQSLCSHVAAALPIFGLALRALGKPPRASPWQCEELPAQSSGGGTGTALAAQHCGFVGSDGGRFPFVVLDRGGALDEELLSYLRASFGKWPPSTKRRWSRGEGRGGSYVWKLDWHAVPGLPERASIFLPRPDKASNSAARAPEGIFGFVQAFRQANAGIFDAIAADLEARAAVAQRSSKPPSWAEAAGGLDVLRGFAHLIRQRRHLGVIEVQLFKGQHPVEPGPHNDGTTSVLHLSVTLGGVRTVHSKMEHATGEEPTWNSLVQRPGDVYFSSPSFYMHRVSYEPTPASDPMVAMHLRFGFPPDWSWHINQRWDGPIGELARVVAEHLRRSEGTLVIPSLEAVKTAAATCRARFSQESED